MKKSAALVFLALALALMFSLAVPAAASNGNESITVTCRAIRIVVDGTEITPTDASGQPVEPFIYNGTTFLPVRAVARALALTVAWDEATSTVTLTSGGTADPGSGTAAATNGTKTIAINRRDIRIVMNGTEITPTDANGNAVEPFIYDGTTYLPVRAVASALGVAVAWDDAASTVYLGEQPQETVWLTKTETEYYADGSIKRQDTYTYDELWRCTAIASHYPEDPDRDSTITRTFDGDGRLIFEDYGDGYSRYSYDDAGNLVSDKYYYGGSMVEWQYAYDAAGRISLKTTLDQGDIVTTAAYTYNARGDLVTLVTDYPENPDYDYTENYSYVYDAAGRLASLGCDYTGSYEYGTFRTYYYDDAGRLSVEYQYWVEDGEKTYYDTNHYAYDENGNLASVTYDSGCVSFTYVAVTL
jgi:YD repeat-containing protein